MEKVSNIKHDSNFTLDPKKYESAHQHFQEFFNSLSEKEQKYFRKECVEEPRNLLLPNPPKGYPELLFSLKTNGAHYEQSMHLPVESILAKYNKKMFHDLFNENGAQLELWKIAGIQRWVQSGLRNFYPTKEIVDACKATDATSSVYGTDIKKVYPTFLLTLPNGCGWTSTDGDYCGQILVDFYNAGDECQAHFSKTDYYTLAYTERRIVITLYWDSYAIQTVCVPMDDTDKTIREVLETYTSEEHFIQSNEYQDYGDDGFDNNVGFKVSEFVMNALLIMQSYPEYVDNKETKTRGYNTKKLNRKCTVSTISIPTNLRQVVDHVPTTGESVACDNTKRKTHMRRGHWRRQRHKDGWEIDNPKAHIIIMPDGGHAHMKWIKPVIVLSTTEKEKNNELL